MIAGMSSEKPIQNVQDYINMVKAGQMRPFLQNASGNVFEIGTGLQCDSDLAPGIHSLLYGD